MSKIVRRNRKQPLRPIVIGLWIVAAMASASRAVVPGDVAPAFTLQDLSGTSFSLSDFAGEVVLLAFVGYG